MLDGHAGIDALAAKAAAFDQPALGLTDHGNLHGAIEHYKACKTHGIKPILGFEAYFVDDRNGTAPRYERNHLTLLAENDAGFRNLVKLASAGFLEGMRAGKPNVDMELLDRHSDGLIALTGCLASRFCQRLVADNPQAAREHADQLLGVFGRDNVYFEIQQNKVGDQDKVNPEIARIAREVGRPLVGTADVHYLTREDHKHHHTLLCVQTKSTLADPKMTFETNEFFLKDNAEMAQDFAPWPEAIPTTLEIAERCNVEIELGKMLIPSFETPDGSSEADYLRRQALAGLHRRYGDPPPAEAVERLDMELEVIGRMGFDAYFLIVWDFIKYAKENNIAVGPGRGSAAGSIVSYCLDITELDPLAYGLLFERFLNPERVSMPDIDIDFSVQGRARVMRYVSDKYGKESVAQIVTFGKMLPRNATRDAARVLGKEYVVGDRLAKLIPEPVMGRSKSFEEYLKEEPELRRAYDQEADAREVIDAARGLEGIVRNAGIHAAAVVIADRPLTDIVPLALMDAKDVDEDGNKAYRTVTQYSMKPIEEMGLLKMDFLGLRNLDVIEDCLTIIEQSTGEARLDMANLPLDDVKTYEMMARGESVGVFQFESDGMREALRKVKPTEFEDLVALNALYRPGAMRYIDTYAKNKRNPEAVVYLDERLRPITQNTYSVTLYQEQSMQIAKTLAGFTGAQADDLRKAIGKKNRQAMGALKATFFEGARASGTQERVIEELWSINEASADYSFNRSHAACYGLISYRTAWLKANYPAEYMAALISSVMSTKDKVPFFVSACEEMGIEVLPPDVNVSGNDFLVAGGNIRFGLSAVKGVGGAAVERIIAAREDGGPITSIWDFCRRVDSRTVNKKAIEALIKCGALDSTGATRAGMMSVLEQAQGAGQKFQEDAQLGQGSIFDLEEPAPGGVRGGGLGGAPDLPVPALPDERPQLNAWEKETLGLFLSSHPLKEVRAALRQAAELQLSELSDKKDGDWVTVGGMITECKKIRTRKGDPMAFATLDDLTGSVEMLVFNSAYAKNSDMIEVDKVVIVRGRVDHKEDGVKLIAQEVTPFEPTPEEVAAAQAEAELPPAPKRVTLDVEPDVPAALLDELKDVCRGNPGDHDVVVVVGQTTVRLGNEFRIRPSGACLAELEGLTGVARRAA